MKFLRLALCLTLLIAPASARVLRGSAPPVASPTANSQISPNSPADFPFINYVKMGASGNWSYGSGGAPLHPDELDSNGYPLPGGAWVTTGGTKAFISTPSQFDYPGHILILWTGQGNPVIGPNGTGVGRLTSCTGGNGSNFGGGSVKCDNTACSTFTGSIAGATLTVTAAPTGTGCALGNGQPISWGAGFSGGVSQFGTPTIITSSGSACGGDTCYTVNQSQTVASTTMLGGVRLEMNLTTPFSTAGGDQYSWSMSAVGSGSQYLQNLAILNVADEARYQNSATPCGSGKACIVSSIFQTRVQSQANFGVIRDLDWTFGNVSSCSTWDTRKPTNYWSYLGNELRNAASGTTTYTAGGQIYTIPKQGQYIDSGGTGASGGTVSYNAGTDVYSITLGSGNFVDKQTFHILVPTTGTTASVFSLNGNTGVGLAIGSGIQGSAPAAPSSTAVTTYIYDALLNKLLQFTQAGGGNGGMQCGMPPEVFVELNAELKTAPFHVLPYLALDPMTDWVTQYATYVKNNYPSPLTRFEVTNEPFNCASGPFNAYYLSAKSSVYVASDAAWPSLTRCGSNNASNPDEIGKMASTAGQDLVATLGAGNYELLVPLKTFDVPSAWTHVLTSQAYVNQTIAPTQTGYTQTPAYQYATRISLNDYWATGVEWENSTNNGNSLAGLETGYAYCYYFYSTSTACQGAYASQAAVMSAYMGTSTATTCGGELCSWGNIPNYSAVVQTWQNAATNCFSGSRPGNCTINVSKSSMGYEGGFSPNNMTALKGTIPSTINAAGDILQPLAGAKSNGSNTDLIIHNNGCVVGQTIALSSLVGGTWSTAAGNYAISAVSGDTCTIPLNSAGLGTFGTGTTTSTAGWTTASTTISVASCTGMASGQRASDTTTGKYIGTVSSCTSGTLTLANYPAFNAGSNGDTITFVASSAIATYTNSFTWISALRNAAYAAPELDSLSGQLYSAMSTAGMAFPSQYQLSSGGQLVSNNAWLVFAYNIYGYYPMGKCTSCTIASTTLTLGGTITGTFGVGQTLIGGGVTGIGTGAGSNTTISSCTPIGSNVCGTTAGDTLGLSQASTVASGTGMTSNIAPGAPGSGLVSPVRAFHAICTWNSNGSAC